ncbi:MAG: hypothetical protein AABW91_04530 [Nanoarchaeota archaeon]
MKEKNNIKIIIIVIGIIFILGLSLVSAGSLFGGKKGGSGGGLGGMFGGLFGGGNQGSDEDTSSSGSASVPDSASVPASQENDFETYGIDLDSLEWDVDPPVWHSADEIKIKADNGNYYSLQEALDYGLITLPIGEIPQGVLIDFNLPGGSPEWYNKVCPSGYGKNKKEQYADYLGEFTITNPFIYEGGVYDFSCTIGDKPGTVTSRVQLSENYTIIITTQEPKISKIQAIMGNKEVESGEDKYSYLVSLEGNKLRFRITRPSSCRNTKISGFNIPLCIPQKTSGSSSGLSGFGGMFGISDETNQEIQIEELQFGAGVTGSGYCLSGSGCNNFPISEIGGCTGAYCNCRLGRGGCYSSIGQIPVSPSSVAFNQRPQSKPDCSSMPSANVNLPTKKCVDDQCPIYTVKSGIFGGFKQKEIYKWGEIKCDIRAAY